MRKDIALPVLALAGGGACLALRRWQLAAALDPETELFRSVPATPVLIGVLALLALLFLVLIQGGGKPEDYPAAFRCPSSLYMTLVTAGSLLLLAAAALGTLGFFRAFQLWRDGLGQGLPVMELLAAVLCIPSAAALMILGRGHYRGGLPACYPGLTTLPGYAALPWLVGIYQEYSRDPVVLRFADMILAVVCAVLALYFAASFAFRHPRPRLCLFFSLMGIVLNLEALANGQSLFFTALTAAAVLVLLARCCAPASARLGRSACWRIECPAGHWNGQKGTMPREEPGSRIIIGRTTEYGTQEILYHHPYLLSQRQAAHRPHLLHRGHRRYGPV